MLQPPAVQGKLSAISKAYVSIPNRDYLMLQRRSVVLTCQLFKFQSLIGII